MYMDGANETKHACAAGSGLKKTALMDSILLGGLSAPQVNALHKSAELESSLMDWKSL